MFSEEEINLMRSLGLDCDFNGLSETDEYWADIEEKVGNFLTLKCLDEHYNPDSNGIICESILNKIPVQNYWRPLKKRGLFFCLFLGGENSKWIYH